MEWYGLVEMMVVAILWGIAGFIIGFGRGGRTFRKSAYRQPKEPVYSKGRLFFVLTDDEWHDMQIRLMIDQLKKATRILDSSTGDSTKNIPKIH